MKNVRGGYKTRSHGGKQSPCTIILANRGRFPRTQESERDKRWNLRSEREREVDHLFLRILLTPDTAGTSCVAIQSTIIR